MIWGERVLAADLRRVSYYFKLQGTKWHNYYSTRVKFKVNLFLLHKYSGQTNIFFFYISNNWPSPIESEQEKQTEVVIRYKKKKELFEQKINLENIGNIFNFQPVVFLSNMLLFPFPFK